MNNKINIIHTCFFIVASLFYSSDEKSKTIIYTYDTYLDKPISKIDPDNNETVYTYDSLGNNITIN